MYPLPTAEDFRKLQQLRDRKRFKYRAERIDNDQRDVEEIAELLSAVVDTPLKGTAAAATCTMQVEASRNAHVKENKVPAIREVEEMSKTFGKKRALCDGGENTGDVNKAVRCFPSPRYTSFLISPSLRLALVRGRLLGGSEATRLSLRVRSSRYSLATRPIATRSTRLSLPYRGACSSNWVTS